MLKESLVRVQMTEMTGQFVKLAVGIRLTWKKARKERAEIEMSKLFF